MYIRRYSYNSTQDLKHLLTLLSSFLLIQSACLAQTKIEALENFDKDLGYHFGLYSGREYQYRLLKGSNPFFKEDSWAPGKLTVNNQTFSEVSMIYDIEQDVLVIRKETDNLNASIQLDISTVQQFSIGNSLFIPGMVKGNLIYLEVLFQGKSISFHNTYTKRRKVSAQTSQVFYDESIDSFIKDTNGYQSLSRNKTILKIYPDIKSKVKNYVKSNRLSWNDKTDFLAILSFIDGQL